MARSCARHNARSAAAWTLACTRFQDEPNTRWPAAPTRPDTPATSRDSRAVRLTARPRAFTRRVAASHNVGAIESPRGFHRRCQRIGQEARGSRRVEHAVVLLESRCAARRSTGALPTALPPLCEWSRWKSEMPERRSRVRGTRLFNPRAEAVYPASCIRMDRKLGTHGVNASVKAAIQPRLTWAITFLTLHGDARYSRAKRGKRLPRTDITIA